MRLLYNILFPFLFVIGAPYYFWKLVRRGNWRPHFVERFGGYGQLAGELKDHQVLWLHAVSVGEANLAVQLVEALQPQIVDWKIVVSTTTTTGRAELERKLPEGVRVVYYPIDWLPFVGRAFRAMNPAAIVLVEAEIWPNLFWQAIRAKVPMHLVNARLSANSARGYEKWSFIFKPLFASLESVGVHHEADAKRLEAVGSIPDAITVTGNLKFDQAASPPAGCSDAASVLDQMGVSERPVLLGGSTFDGEEAILAEHLPRWQEACPELFLIVVPRHCERAAAVEAALQNVGLQVARRTELENSPEKPDVLLVDTTGELKAFFEVATIVFMGKSLTAQGGQNPIEPAAVGKPVVFGPFMQNFAAVTRQLLEVEGAVQVADEAELAAVVDQLLADEVRRQRLGAAAREVVEANQGATQRTAEYLGKALRALK
ncbi:MAG TPA: hypothetical protein DGP39_03550 [Verrucomicrobiales bacterium]|nr:hypothetical protein [Verrucomicrobiales bacterium]